MLVTIYVAKVQLALFVGHAPTTKRGKKAIEKWWQEATETAHLAPPGALRVCLIDTNARIGSV